MKRFATYLALTFFLPLAWGIALAAEKGSGSPLDAIKPGEWYEVPNSNLSAVAAKPGQDLGEFRDIMRAWNGAAYDTKRERLIIWGGGHVNYGGNEVYVFDISTLKWERLTEPSPTTLKGGKLNVASGQTDRRLNADGTPISKHSYDGLEYLPEPVDRLIQYGGSRWFSGGEDELVWFFDFSSRTWERKKDAPLSTLTPMSAYDPKTGNYYVQNSSRLLEYNLRKNTWNVIGSTGEWSSGGVAEIDPIRRRFITIENGRMFYYDLDSSRPLQRMRLKTSGDTEIEKSHAPGFAYNTKADCFVAWSGTTTDNVANGLGDVVFVLDPESLVWTRIKFTGMFALPRFAKGEYPGKSHGTFGRWRYIPSKDLFIGVNNVSDNIYFYRLPFKVIKGKR